MATPSLQLPGRLTKGLRVPARSVPGEALWSVTERLLAGGLLMALLPVLAVVLLAVALVSRKSPLIAHRRLGRHGREFWMLKVRTMWGRNQPALKRSRKTRKERWIEFFIEPIRDSYVPTFKGSSDPRVTSPLAVFCRRFSLDELPQLIHVLTGTMRLVGPRPITRAEWDEHYGDSYLEVLSVLPGLTGLWQMMGRNRLTYAQRRRLDLFYARRWTLGLDLMLLLRTPVLVLRARDSG